MIVPTHVVIDNLPTNEGGPFGWNEPTWVALNAVMASLAAIATGVLAWFTRGLALQTRDMAVETRDLVSAAANERLQVERHHQQGMMPLVYIEVECYMRAAKGETWIGIRGEIKNIGVGPSTGINLLIKPAAFVERISYQGVLGAGERRPLSVEWRLSGPVPFQDNVPYDCIVRFATIFETEGAVHQRSHSGLAQDTTVQDFVSPPDRTAKAKILQMIGNLGIGSSPISA